MRQVKVAKRSSWPTFRLRKSPTTNLPTRKTQKNTRGSRVLRTLTDRANWTRRASTWTTSTGTMKVKTVMMKTVRRSKGIARWWRFKKFRWSTTGSSGRCTGTRGASHRWRRKRRGRERRVLHRVKRWGRRSWRSDRRISLKSAAWSSRAIPCLGRLASIHASGTILRRRSRGLR